MCRDFSSVQNLFRFKHYDFVPRALGKDHNSWDGRLRQVQCRATRRIYGLPRGQAKICRTSPEVMPHVSKAASQTLDTCQQLFQTRRWNCSTALLAPNYTPDLTTGIKKWDLRAPDKIPIFFFFFTTGWIPP